MDDNIEFSLHKVPKALSAKPYYRAVVQNKGIFDNDGLADRLAEHTKEAAIHWRYFLNVLSDEIETLLLEGNRVNLGRLAMSLSIRDSFSSEDEEFDPSKHSLAAVVRTLKPFKDKLEAVVPKNISAGLTCRVAAAMDAVTKRLAEITGTNRLLLQGRRLGISPDNPDEGVWLANPKTGKIAAVARVDSSDDQTRHVHACRSVSQWGEGDARPRRRAGEELLCQSRFHKFREEKRETPASVKIKAGEA